MRRKKIFTITLICALFSLSLSGSAAASNYNAQKETTYKLFPGDIITNITEGVILPDSWPITVNAGAWENNSEKVYSAQCELAETGNRLLLSELGYAVTLQGAVFNAEKMPEVEERKQTDTDSEETDETASPEENETISEAAYFEPGETVSILASAPEGSVFDHWEGTGIKDGQEIIFDDRTNPDASFVMIEDAVTIKAVMSDNETGDSIQETENYSGTEYLLTVEEPELITLDGGIREDYGEDGSVTARHVPSGSQVNVHVSDEAADVVGAGIIRSSDSKRFKALKIDGDDRGWSFTMPEGDTVLLLYREGEEEVWDTAEEESLKEKETEHEAIRYSLTVKDTINTTVNGADTAKDGKLSAKAGTMITIVAVDQSEKQFNGFHVTSESGTEIELSAATDFRYTFRMPEGNIVIDTEYGDLPVNSVSVKNGAGSGQYKKRDVVVIESEKLKTGYRFDKWEVVTGNVEIKDASAQKTSFVMGDEPVTVKATFAKQEYPLTVKNGSGSGDYQEGTEVHIEASFPESGQVFAGWDVTASTDVTPPTKYTDTFVMPGGNTTLEAVYTQGVSADKNRIEGVSEGQKFAKGEKITFLCTGAGADNTAPNPGDYRYRPVSYTVASASKSFIKGRYKKSIAISLTGKYALDVTFAKDVYDGTEWVEEDQNADVKSVTLEIVDPEHMQVVADTDDPSKGNGFIQYIPYVCAAAALLLFLFLFLTRKKRKNKVEEEE